MPGVDDALASCVRQTIRDRTIAWPGLNREIARTVCGHQWGRWRFDKKTTADILFGPL